MRVIWLDWNISLRLLLSYGWFKTDKVAYRVACYSIIVCCFWFITTGCTAPDGSESTLPSDSDLTITADVPPPSLEQSSVETLPPSKNPGPSTGHSEGRSSSSKGEGETEGVSEDIRQRLLEAIASDLSQPVEALTLESATPQTWPNGCLGLATADEVCTMALVDGWQVNIQAHDTLVTYRSNADGTFVRRAP